MGPTRPVLNLLVLVSLTACAHAQTPVPEAARIPSSDQYVIRPGDRVAIQVWPDVTLSGEFPVEESGVVYLPMLGPVPAVGSTTSAFRAEVRSRYGEAMRTPVVSVTPLFQVGVLGEVLRPGLYTVGPTGTIFDAISLAGGFNPQADHERVSVIREGRVYQINADQAIQVGDPVLALTLRSGDRIIVPRKRSFPTMAVLYALQTGAIIASILITR